MAKRPPATATCVLYDPADGDIHLVHTVVYFRGAKPRSWQAVEKEARQILSESRRDRAGLKSMRVNARAIEPGVPYRVVRGKLTRTP
jgi:hypothetical protein